MASLDSRFEIGGKLLTIIIAHAGERAGAGKTQRKRERPTAGRSPCNEKWDG